MTTKRLTITRDSVSRVIGGINALVGKQVLVGIPDSTTSREQELESDITNAALGYIHEFGSPEVNIPARPFLIPGVTNAEAPAGDELVKAANATMRGDPQRADEHLQRAGLIAMASARREISEGAFVPLQPATVAARHRQRKTKSMRASEKKYLELVDGGMDPGEAQVVTGIRPLINTAQLRNSLTYVVRKK